ncbi:dTDP-L-rhamnose 4-epimerase [compost metagenome]
MAAAAVAALTRPGLGCEVINVGSGECVTLLELLRLLGEVVGRKPRLRFSEPRPGDVLHSQADVQRLSRLLGFRAQHGLDEGLERTMTWLAAVRFGSRRAA